MSLHADAGGVSQALASACMQVQGPSQAPACLCMQMQGVLRLWHQPACRCSGLSSSCVCLRADAGDVSGSGITLHADAGSSQAPACLCTQTQGTSQAVQGERRTRRRRRKLELKLARARTLFVIIFIFYFSDFSDLYFPIFRTFPESPGDFSNSRDVLQNGKIKFPDGPGGKIGTEKSEK